MLRQQEVGGQLALFGIADMNRGTMWVSLGITGRPAACSTALSRAARS
jgi:hypothetical protein